jgi:hypothetical protein
MRWPACIKVPKVSATAPLQRAGPHSSRTRQVWQESACNIAGLPRASLGFAGYEGHLSLFYDEFAEALSAVSLLTNLVVSFYISTAAPWLLNVYQSCSHWRRSARPSPKFVLSNYTQYLHPPASTREMSATSDMKRKATASPTRLKHLLSFKHT